MESLLQDCRYAVRTLAGRPGFTAVAVLVLTLGIGANTAVFSLTNALLLRPIVAEEPDRLVALYGKDTSRPDSYRAFSYPNFADIRESNTVFSGIMAHDLTTVGVREGDVTRRMIAEIVSSDYFETLGVAPFRGRFFTPAEEVPGSAVPVVVVSHEYWRSAGADPGMVGETLHVNGEPLTVVGIAPRGFTGRTALVASSLYLPLGMHHRLMNDAFLGEQRPLGERDHHTLFLVGRLRSGLTVAEAEARLETLSARMAESFPAVNEDQTIVLGPISRFSVSTSPTDDGPVSVVALLLMGMTGIVLLIACINLANMLLARGAARRKEFAVRAALGGGRGRIMRQLLTEGLMLSIAGGAAGLVAAWWVTSLLAASLSELLALNALGMTVVLDPVPDVRVLLATAGFCVLGTLLFGLGPAWRQSRPDLMDELKEQGFDATDTGRGLLSRSNLLVVGQIALSLVLLTSAGLFIRGSLAAADVDPGFSLEDGLLVEVAPSLLGYEEERTRELYRRLLGRLREIPGIEEASLAATVPFGAVSSGESVRRAEDPVEDPDGDGSVAASSNVIGRGYFDALGVPVLRGRGFTDAETGFDSGPRVAIVDELLADRLWPDEDPLGRRVRLGADPREVEIVGVVPTLRDDLLPAELQPHVYVPFGQSFQTDMHVHLRAGATDARGLESLLRTVREGIREVDERLPILALRTLEGHIAQSASLWIVRVGARVFGAFGGLALFLAVVGVYGVRSYTVARRTREIGLRQALGASTRDTLWLVLREGLALTGAGLTVGLLLAAGVSRLLGNLLYEVSAFDPVAFTTAPLVLAAAALLATWIPARRAARVAPVIALRED